MKHIWKKDGVEITYETVASLYNAYEEKLTPEETKADAKAARLAVGEVESDGVTILPDTDARKAKYLMYFGPFMVASGITYESQA